MFVSNQQKMGLAIGILLGAMGTPATLSAADASRLHLSDDQRLATSAQSGIQQVSQSATKVRPMIIHDLAGTGATVAVIDTGVSERTALSETPDRFLRLLAACGAEGEKSYTPRVTYSESAGNKAAPKEASGEPSLVVARAFSVNGATSYRDAIRVIEWVVSNKDRYHIRALDLSFIPPTSSTRADDPLNQAVMAAWNAEVVVVSSADTLGI
jgi:subtilisin family serine protease